MNIAFYKYHGAGNDFIIIDNRNTSFPKNKHSFIEKLCNRRVGIGADGLLLLENDKSLDFRMIYFNADGKESTMCGNGGRCIVAFAKKLAIIKDKTSFHAIDGIHHATIDSDNFVNLQMKNVENIEMLESDFVLDTGSPHYVKIVNEYSDAFIKEAKNIRNSPRFFKDGINVNFIKINKQEVEIRTYERGVEDETLACGTGCVAAALCVMQSNKILKEISLKAKGGNLKVQAEKTENGFKNIWLWGPTSFVFSGNYLEN